MCKGHILGNVRRVEMSEDGKVDSESCNKESNSKVNITNHRMPWPVASPETIPSLVQPTHWVITIRCVKKGTQLHSCAHRYSPCSPMQPYMQHSVPLRGSGPAGGSLATLCNLEKQFNVFVEHDSHPGCGLAEANRHTLNMTAAAFP